MPGRRSGQAGHARTGRDGRAEPPIRYAPTVPVPGSETNDQRPSAVTATPNGVPGADSIEAGTVCSADAAAAATLQPGTRAVAVTGAADAGRAGPTPGEAAAVVADGVGASMRPPAGWVPDEQAAAATAAAAVTRTSGDLTCPG
jgi:hypothetical protein